MEENPEEIEIIMLEINFDTIEGEKKKKHFRSLVLSTMSYFKVEGKNH